MVQHNEPVIRGMGLYTPEGVDPVTDVRNWESPGDSHPEPKLRDLRDRCLATEDGFVWLGLFEPTRSELDMVAGVFELPPLLVEDAANTAQRPKFEFDAHGRGMALLKVLDYVEPTSDVLTGQLAIFVGDWFAVTVRYGQIGDLRASRLRLESSRELREYGPMSVLYAVLDQVVDGYLTITDEVNEDVENLEAQVFSGEGGTSVANGIYRLKRENIEMRRAVGPLVSWAHDVVEEQVSWVPPGLRGSFRDVGEHVLRANDATESADNLLMAMLMASTSLQDLQQNRDMRKISAWVAIAAVPTAIAAIYGMNFEVMPELDQPWGYPAVLGVMALTCVLLFRAFKRSGWL